MNRRNYIQIEEFKRFLKQKGMSENTIQSYSYSVEAFFKMYTLEIESLLEYRGMLLQKYKPKTVNLRIQILNHAVRINVCLVRKQHLCFYFFCFLSQMSIK